MARSFDGVNDNIKFGNLTDLAGITAFSVSIWVLNDSLTNDDNLVEMSTSDGATYGWRLYRDDVGSQSGRTDMYNSTVTESSGAGGAGVRIEGATNSSASGIWQHVFFSFQAGSITGLQQWVNGVEDANSPADVSALADNGPTNTHLTFGETNGGVADRDGDLAECGIWTRVLSDAEIISLSKGFSPLFYLKDLARYIPLIGKNSPETDLKKGGNGIVTGSIAASHPRIIYPRGMR